MSPWKRLKQTILLLPLTICLQGCVEAAFSGASMVYNRYSLQSTLNDNYTTMHTYRELYLDTHRFKNTHVTVNTFHGEVLLTGQVANAELYQALGPFVKKISGANKVYNFTTISTQRSSLVRMQDTWISTKINSQLLPMIDIDFTQIKVVTENHVVFLMGTVTPEQGRIAINIARHTHGVKAVMDLFSYVVKLTKANKERANVF